jgi:CheY-like chemotaxis protein
VLLGAWNGPQRTIDILLVEDSLPDIHLTREALREVQWRSQLHVVRDGQAALQFVRQVGDYSDAPRPDLILLDLNLPKKDGRDVLRELKGDPTLRSIPVVVLTTSDTHEDVLNAYDLLANSYITKPSDFDGFVEVIQSLQAFWLDIVQLPPKEAKH